MAIVVDRPRIDGAGPLANDPALVFTSLEPAEEAGRARRRQLLAELCTRLARRLAP